MKDMLYTTRKSIIFIILSVLIGVSYGSYCGSYVPFGPSSCHEFTNTTSICCFLRGNFEGAYHSMCYPFSRDVYYKMSRKVAINGYEYDLNCGTKRGALCGDIVNPVNYKDCGVYSTKKNSCCFYKYQYKLTERDTEWITDTNCIWLGSSDIGSMTYRKLTVSCSSKTLCYSKYLMIISIMIFLFF